MGVDMAEWQIWGASTVAHLIDPNRAVTKRSGIKARCGKYTGKGVLAPFFAINAIEPGALRAIRHYAATACPECRQSFPTEPSDL